MAEQTTNLGLTKPDAAEGYDINVFNNNADIIDGAVGTVLNEIGTTGSGGMSDKVTQTLNDVNTLQDGLTAARLEIAAVKTDTAALVKALATANQNIATLLVQTKGVKSIAVGDVISESPATETTFNIPQTMNAEKVVIILNYRSKQSVSYGIDWTRNGHTVTVDTAVSNVTVKYQIIEFY